MRTIFETSAESAKIADWLAERSHLELSVDFLWPNRDRALAKLVGEEEGGPKANRTIRRHYRRIPCHEHQFRSRAYSQLHLEFRRQPGLDAADTNLGSYVVNVTATTTDSHQASSFAGMTVTQPTAQ